MKYRNGRPTKALSDMTGADDVVALKAIMTNLAHSLEDPDLNAQSRATLAGRLTAVRKEWRQAVTDAEARKSGLGQMARPEGTVTHIRAGQATHDLLGGPEYEAEDLSNSEVTNDISDAI